MEIFQNDNIFDKILVIIKESIYYCIQIQQNTSIGLSTLRFFLIQPIVPDKISVFFEYIQIVILRVLK